MVTMLLLGALAGAMPADIKTADAEPGHARLTRSYTQHLAGPPRAVFPLLGPVGEKTWGGEAWRPRFIYPPGGADVKGCIFATGGPGSETIWMLTVFDADALAVEYVQVTPGLRVTDLRIDLRAETGGGTAAEIRYTWTSLSAQGDGFIDAHRGPMFEHAMAGWESAINDYLGGQAGTAGRAKD